MSLSSDLKGKIQELSKVFANLNTNETPILNMASKPKIRQVKFDWTEYPMYTAADNAAAEGADFNLADPTLLVEKSNNTQIFSKTVVMTGSQMASAVVGNMNELNEQIARKMEELKLDMEKAFVGGQAAVASGTRKSASLQAQLDATVIKDLASAAITEADFIGHLAKVYKAGCRPTKVVAEPLTLLALQTAISTAGGRVREMAAGQKTATGVVTYVTQFGTLDFIMANNVPSGTILLIDPSMIEVPNFRTLEVKDVPIAGDREGAALVAEVGFKVKHSKGCAAFVNVKV